MLVMRSLLFVPANRPDMVETARETAADVVVLDLEDTVPPAEKEPARGGLRAAIDSLQAAGKSVHVRVNHLDTGLTRDDLVAAVGPGLDGLIFPKTGSAQDIRRLDVLIREQETHNGVRPGTVVLIPFIESARGVLRCEEIAQASTRIAGIGLGPYDYAADLGVARTAEGRELDYARRVIVHCCAAYGLQALDGPLFDLEDAGALLAESRYARSIGFKGKYVMHPAQVDAVNQVFAPTVQEIEDARRLVAAYDAAVARGDALPELNGKMIEKPMALRARDLIAYAAAIAARRRD